MIAKIRLHIEGARVRKYIRRSLVRDDPGWYIPEQDVHLMVLEHHSLDSQTGEETKIRITLTPRLGSCICHMCDRVMVYLNDSLLPVPCGDVFFISIAARMWLLRDAARKLKKALPKPQT